MSRTCPKLFAVVIATLLALPPGWCCLLPAPSPATSDTPSVPMNDCCCGSESTPHSEQPNNQPTAPQPPRTCCCGHRDLLRGAAPGYDVAKDLSTVELVPQPLLRFAFANPFLMMDRLDPMPSQPLHVLDCVWRC